jgi:hypothetical protein
MKTGGDKKAVFEATEKTFFLLSPPNAHTL